jgi:hypothetical protein
MYCISRGLNPEHSIFLVELEHSTLLHSTLFILRVELFFFVHRQNCKPLETLTQTQSEVNEIYRARPMALEVYFCYFIHLLGRPTILSKYSCPLLRWQRHLKTPYQNCFL